MSNLLNLTLVERDVLKRGLLHVLDNSKTDEDFDAARRINQRLDGPSGRFSLDVALDLQSQKLFAAEAIIKSVADSIEQRYEDDLSKAGTEIPNYPRALAQAVSLIRDCYHNMEIPTLTTIAEELEAHEATKCNCDPGFGSPTCPVHKADED